MELKNLYVEFSANLLVDEKDIQVLHEMSKFPVGDLLEKHYHIKVKKEQIKETMDKIYRVTKEVLECRKLMMEASVKSDP